MIVLYAALMGAAIIVLLFGIVLGVGAVAAMLDADNATQFVIILLAGVLCWTAVVLDLSLAIRPLVNLVRTLS